MNSVYYPKLYVDSINDITDELLQKNGIRGLILDIDNTLVPNHVADADENAVAWIEKMKASGYKMCIVSNASKNRVVRFNDRLKLYAVHRAMKPYVAPFMKAAGIMGLEKENIAVVGDQIFTDIYGGNRAGMFTILVRPIDVREGRLVRFKRIFEKRILDKYHESKR
jgi:HAD superfamily phosphatase (TIGR01668 family)